MKKRDTSPVTRVRVSLSFFNNARDVDRFLEVSERLGTTRARGVIGVAVLLALVALFASYLSARRTAGVDPKQALCQA